MGTSGGLSGLLSGPWAEVDTGEFSGIFAGALIQKGLTVSSAPSPSDKISVDSELMPQRDGAEDTVGRLNEALTNDPPSVDDCLVVAKACLKAGNFRGAMIAVLEAEAIRDDGQPGPNPTG